MNRTDGIIPKQCVTPPDSFHLTKRTGFTLVELLVAVIIVGVLSSLAVPIFRQNIRRVMATEGHALVGAIRTAQRIYFAENNRYTSNWVDIEGAVDINNNKYFKTVPVLTASGTGSEATFTATVTGTGDASQISVSINNKGVMTADGI
jgi:prepilin-type N-terminal cleavage/methylation domain-containing protein